MKNLTLLLLFQICVFSYGQKYGAIWQFGYNAGIDFNSCTPVPLLTGSNNGYEGCSAVSDTTGQLLFYTNSDIVWNKQNTSMPNGNINSSSGTLSQVLIIPKPGSKTIYYVITTQVQGSGPLTFQYHVVDMSLNGGLGDVISKNNVITTATITEQVAATYQSNGSDIWLMTHEYGNNNFLAYSVTSAGISLTPVISSVGPTQIVGNSNFNARGEIKFSPDGTKLAFNGNGIGTNDATNLLALFDFNRSTGVVSNPLNLPYCRGEFGLSFSPDNSKLYGATWKAFSFQSTDYNYIYQFDLSSSTPSLIVNSRQKLDSVSVNDGIYYGSLKLGPDGKIYVAYNSKGYLGVINYPNAVGLACNYVSNSFYLGGKIGNVGLNNYIEYQTYCGEETVGINASQEKNTELTVFPNPFTSSARLEFSNPTMENHTLNIYDCQGRLVHRIENIKSNNVEINRESLTSGFYFLRLQSATRTIRGKLILE